MTSDQAREGAAGRAPTVLASSSERSGPVTEEHLAERRDLDLRGTRELVELINDEDATVAAAVRRASPALASAIDRIVERLRGGGRLVYVGAGSSGRLALVDSAGGGPTFGIADDQVVAIVAGGAAPPAGPPEAAG